MFSLFKYIKALRDRNHGFTCYYPKSFVEFIESLKGHGPLTRRQSCPQLEILESRTVPAATLKWVGGDMVTGVVNNNWNVPGNWTPAIKPANGDTLKFDNTSANNSTDNMSGLKLANLIVTGYTHEITLGTNQAPATLTTTDGTLNTTTATSTNFSIGGPGNLQIAGQFTWNSGTIAGPPASQLVVQARATLTISSSTDDQKDARLAGRSLIVKGGLTPATGGTVKFTSGQLFIENNAAVTGQAGVTTQIQNNGAFQVSGTASGIVGAPCTFTNDGTFSMSLNSGQQFSMNPAFQSFTPPDPVTTPLYVSVNSGTHAIRHYRALPRVELLESRDLLATYTWLGPANPQPNAPPTNWDAKNVWQVDGERTTASPTTGDSVIFNSTSNANVVLDVANIQLESLTITSGFNIGTIQLQNSLNASCRRFNVVPLFAFRCLTELGRSGKF